LSSFTSLIKANSALRWAGLRASEEEAGRWRRYRAAA
jgi:hypothetical protein